MIKIKEIKANELDARKFIEEEAKKISATVGDGLAINALSGGVDSSAVTMLGHKALGSRLKTYFIDNGIMRKDEPRKIASLFKDSACFHRDPGCQERFLRCAQRDNRSGGEARSHYESFHKKVFGRLVKKSGARHLLQGTILTDIDETVAGIKRQHNVFEQLGIDPEKAFGYKIIEPLVRLRKDGVRKLAAGSPDCRNPPIRGYHFQDRLSPRG